MKKLSKWGIILCTFLVLSFASVTLAVSADLILFGGMYSSPVDQPITVSWDPQEDADGFELKINHFLYAGMESTVVETTDTQYTFQTMPRSSRHFEIMIRAYTEVGDGTRLYSTWSHSTDASCSMILEGASEAGWLIYSTPGAPSW